jgi:diguanylate cyclase (GGDEF)-like protein
MKHPVVWAGRALTVLGLAAVVPAVLHATSYGLLGAIGGFVTATGLALDALLRYWLTDEPRARPTDFTHLADLLRRAHGGRAAWVVGLPDGDDELADSTVDRDARRRGAGIVQLASIDGRAHVTREAEGTFVAVGDFPFGAGVLLADPAAQPALAQAVVADLRRLVAGMRAVGAVERGERAELVAKQLATLAGGAQTLEGVAKAGVELAQQLAQRGAAIVLRGGGPTAAIGPGLQVIAASTAADQRLVGRTVPEGAPAARAVSAAVPVVSHGEEDMFGSALSDRRRQERAGTAFPMMDGHFAIGSLVVTGSPVDPDSPLAEQLRRLVTELGSRLAAARAVHEAEQRAVLDPLTGLRNRRELERQLSRHQRLEGPPAVTLIYLDLDRFKLLNDTLGHAAGDAALRHVAAILQEAIRDTDVAARIGGEEFAVWMPRTPLAQGLEVAERIRHSVEITLWRWDGTPRPFTTSCGVAAYPECVRDINNLRSAADAALYRAKQGGRNRVEKAPPAE